MASIPYSLSLIAVCILAMYASTGFVHGRVVAEAHHGERRQMGCIGTLAICSLPVMLLDKETIQQQVRQEGLTPLCQTVTAVKSCIEIALVQCEEEGEEIPAEFSQAINLIRELTNFLCVEELASINADRECIFGAELEAAVQESCGAVQPSGEICNFSEDLECSLEKYEAVCDGRSLANKFRAFAARVERLSNCGKAKARSATWRQLVTLLRR